MNTNKSRYKIFLFLFFILFACFSGTADAQECKTKEECQQKIQEYEKRLSEIHQQKNTLSSEIKFMDTQIYLTALKVQNTVHTIAKIEDEINTLSDKITGLSGSLDHLSKILLVKIAEGYKNREFTLFDILLDSENASILTQKIKYLKTVQDTDRRMAFRVQQTKDNFEEQKKLREQKVVELDELKVVLDQQKATLNNQRLAKQKLLEVTKNDEKKFQALLDRIRAEYTAIQAIVSGGGSETEIRPVKAGDLIASVISGASCNSSGGHLHFTVKVGADVVNPFGFLKPVDHKNCSGSSCGSGDGDPFNPSGDWDWPLNPTIEMNQGYGQTWAVRNSWVGRIYQFHNGIDINGSSNDVRAVAEGMLYRGGFTGSGGCTLPYVKVVHKEGNISTYYLHVIQR